MVMDGVVQDIVAILCRLRRRDVVHEGAKRMGFLWGDRQGLFVIKWSGITVMNECRSPWDCA